MKTETSQEEIQKDQIDMTSDQYQQIINDLSNQNKLLQETINLKQDEYFRLQLLSSIISISEKLESLNNKLSESLK